MAARTPAKIHSEMEAAHAKEMAKPANKRDFTKTDALRQEMSDLVVGQMDATMAADRAAEHAKQLRMAAR